MDLKPRAVFPKPERTSLAGAMLPNVFVLKWAEGTHIRERNGRFHFDPDTLTSADHARLARLALDRETIAREVDRANALFAGDPDLQFLSMFQRPVEELDKERRDGEAESHEELADLSLYFYVMAKKIGFLETERLIDVFNTFKSVEIAYPQRIPFPPVDRAPATPDFSLAQSYLEPAPQGIDAYYAWAFPGGHGEFSQVIDVEKGWHLDHEDLPPERALIRNHGWNLPTSRNHGTAVLGVLAAQDNGYGVTGIVPQTALGVDSPVAAIPPYDVPGSINRSAAALARGGIILIEQHYPHGPSATPALAYSGAWVPVEDSQGDFDAIRNATARGIVVVEAAANGAQDLDDPFFHGRFDRGVRDSGAILVGAGMPYTGLTEGFSNFGRRVDVHGWGSNVMTLAYGEMVPGVTGDVRQQYTDGFNGTSSASPIVAGAAAAIQSIRRAQGLPTLTSVEMRTLLRDSGTSGVASPRNIGPLPNLRKAIDAMRLPGLPPPRGWLAFSDVPIDGAPVLVRDRAGALACFAIRGARVWWRTQGGPTFEWGPWLQLGDRALAGELTVVLNGAGCLQVFGRGLDREIWTSRQLFPGAGSAWSPWSSIGGGLSGDPVAIVNATGGVEVFARGMDDGLWTNVSETVASGWTGWQPLAGRLSSRPAVATHDDGALTVVAVFKDRSIQTRKRDKTGGWDAEWRLSGGSSRDEPAIARNRDGALDVFIRGLDGALWTSRQWQTTGSPWTRIGGPLAPHTRPAAGLNAFGRMMAFVRWGDNSVHSVVSTGDTSSWAIRDIAGNVTGPPSVVFHADGRYELFARTWNGTIVTVSHLSTA